MKLGVCGCSFMSAISGNSSQGFAGGHFTEMLAGKLGWDYINLSRGACSNSVIRLQVEEIIKSKPDLVMLGTTTQNRLEFPIKEKTYDDTIGLYNIDYIAHKSDSSSSDIRFNSPTMVSDTLNNIINRDDISNNFISKEHIVAINYYFKHLFDSSFRGQQDSWIIHSSISLLQESNIPFVLILQPSMDRYIQFQKSSKSIVSIPELWPWKYYDPLSMRRWHTSDESQRKLADMWFTYLTENNLIKGQK